MISFWVWRLYGIKIKYADWLACTPKLTFAQSSSTSNKHRRGLYERIGITILGTYWMDALQPYKMHLIVQSILSLCLEFSRFIILQR